MRVLFLLLLSGISLYGHAQTRADYQSYIQKYGPLAIAEEQRTGIPASIKMAQALLESGAGNGELALKSNNHFGIKCKSNWTGPVFYHDDDERGECFRGYATVEESFRDHSDFLRNNARYQQLFKLDKNDYEGWAKGLKQAGYATNPKYPQLLMKVIEENNLDSLSYVLTVANPTNEAMTMATPAEEKKAETTEQVIATKEVIAPVANTTASVTIEAEPKASTQKSYPSGEFRINGCKVIFAEAETSLLAIASKHKMSLAQLLDYNDMDDMTVLPAAQLVYLEKKKKQAETETHKVEAGETLWDISQAYGVKLAVLQSANDLDGSDRLTAGSTIKLQAPTGKGLPQIRLPRR